jgi:photosystem II stability/assembly factor-like uncharacterized protein
LLELAVDPLSPNRLVSARRGTSSREFVPGGIFVSADSGRTWRRKVAGDIRSLAVDPASATVYAGGAGILYRSDDRGAHWRMVARLDAKRLWVASLTVDPTDSTSSTRRPRGASIAA